MTLHQTIEFPYYATRVVAIMRGETVVLFNQDGLRLATIDDFTWQGLSIPALAVKIIERFEANTLNMEA